jgi:hypothetical protein
MRNAAPFRPFENKSNLPVSLYFRARSDRTKIYFKHCMAIKVKPMPIDTFGDEIREARRSRKPLRHLLQPSESN